MRWKITVGLLVLGVVLACTAVAIAFQPGDRVDVDGQPGTVQADWTENGQEHLVVALDATTPTPTPTPTPTATPTPTTTPTPSPVPTPDPDPGCTTTVTSGSGLTSAFNAASGGATICLANGSYGTVSLSGARNVTVRSENPDGASITINYNGSGTTFRSLHVINTIHLAAGSHDVLIERNHFDGWVDMASTTTSISDITVRGNRWTSSGTAEDAIRANRYHDADGDGNGLLVEDNEFTGLVQLPGGVHVDVLQSVFGGDHLVFRRNYAHDVCAENFFLKDQPAQVVGVVLDDNLFLRNGADCPASPAQVNVYGPTTGLVMQHNTWWDCGSGTNCGNSGFTWQGSGWGTIVMDHNVTRRNWGSGSGGSWTIHDNTYCEWTGTLPSSGSGSTANCFPAFVDPLTDDYRILGSDRGVDWQPTDFHYGP